MPVLEIKPGSHSSLVRVFTQDDFDRFAALSGDNNPIHVDPHFCARTRFGRTVAHGMFLYSVLSGLVRHSFQDPVLPLEQEMIFRAPTFTGEEVRFEVEIAAAEFDGQNNSPKNTSGFISLKQAVIRPYAEPGLEGHLLCRLLPPTEVSDFESISKIKNKMQEQDLSPSLTGPAAHKGLLLGASASISRTFTAADLTEYHSLTGDPGLDLPGSEVIPLPGSLIGSLFSYLLGAVLPGPGTNWLKQKLRFIAPANPGKELTASVRISRLRPEKDLVNLTTTCFSGPRLICEGESLVLVKDLVYD